MSEFDQLIKQKVDQKKYEYSAKSWQKFAKKAGWKAGLTSLQITAIAAISAVAIAIGGFVGYKHLTSPESHTLQTPPAANMLNPSDTTQSTTTDTIERVLDTLDITPEIGIVNRNQQIDNKKEVHNNQEVATKDNPALTNKNDTIANQKPVVKRKQYTGPIRKVTIIDLDSIKTNDF